MSGETELRAALAVAVGRADRAEAAVREVLEGLDAAREWNYERGRTSSVQRIDFAIAATLSLRVVLADVVEPPREGDRYGMTLAADVAEEECG